MTRIILAVATFLAACRYDVDTARFSVTWTVEGTDCVEPMPWVKLRTQTVGTTVDDDDEYFDWFPCREADGVPLNQGTGLTAPITLGAYAISARLYDAFDGPNCLGATTGESPGEFTVQDVTIPIALTIYPGSCGGAGADQ